ncbi:oxygenase MpaB family protein [Nocardia sp. NPDC050718]|uniref:oxygenase MpaB family protein n=1 Tax=Nocardia sp. NPDC050718 TaxID=3155788 RepID=UPI0033F06E10
MSAEITHHPAPLGPDSVAWQVFGDLTFPLGAGHRLLIDVMHPIVAAGVRQYSVFESDPYGRAQRTLELIMGVVYGGEQALATAARLRELHRGFTGRAADGTRWSALQPEAFHWVHASIVHGVWVQQRLLGRGWRPGEIERFYREMCQVGTLYGVRDKDMPADWAAFVDWFDAMIEQRAERNDITDRVLALIAAPTPPPIPVLSTAPVWNRTGRPLVGKVNALVTAGLLDPKIRGMLGIEWTPARQRAFDRLAALSRAVLPRLPRRARLVPPAYAAIRRARG